MNLPDTLEKEDQIVFKNIKRKIFKNQIAKYIIIRNSIIAECTFENVDIGNCDFICNKICEAEFRNVNFDSADIFSTWFSNCIFQDVDFTGASIEDITFIDCKLVNCIFEDVSLKNCIFNCCSLMRIKPDSCIFSLNNYNLCNFKECSFFGSFQYQIFKECKFSNVLISSSVLQYNFGLGNITSGIEFVHNEKIINNQIDLKNLLISDCISYKLFVNAVITSYNFENYINPELAIQSITALELMLKNNLLLSNDELLFIKQLYHYLYENNLIAPIAIYKMFEAVKKIYNDSLDNIAYLKCKDSIYTVANGLFFDFNNFCEKLIEFIHQIPAYNEPAYIKIHYNEKPTISLVDLLNQCIPNIVHRTRVMQGSFMEFLEIGQNGLELLNIFLQLLGITVPIIYTEITKKKNNEKKEKQASKNVNIKISTEASQNKQEISNLIQQTCQITMASNLLNINLQGYNNDNIKEIKIEFYV